jgi:hypothetical protein
MGEKMRFTAGFVKRALGFLGFGTSKLQFLNRGPVKRALLVLVAGAAAVGSPKAMAYTPPPSDFFPIGVFLQPIATFDTWKARGVNTVVDFWPDPSQTLDQWNNAAVSRGLYMIRAPRPNAALDINEKYLLAWSQPDEPDWNQIAPATLAATYANLKKVDPKRPVYINFAGSMALNPYIAKDGATYKQMMQSADWVANDIYPIAAWNRPEWIDFSKTLNPKDMLNATGKRLNLGAAIDVLRPWSGGKQQMAYIETSWQGPMSSLSGPTGVTPAQMRGETWDAIIHGAKGITYFPQQVAGGQKVDNTPADVAAEITRQDALITSLGGVLNSGNDATDNTVPFTSPLLEGTWRTYNGHKYLFVLNMSSATLTGQTVVTAGLEGINKLQVYNELRDESVANGSLVDNFQPYQLHVYTTALGVATPAVVSGVGTPVPEPTGSVLLVAGLGSALMKRRRRNGAN